MLVLRKISYSVFCPNRSTCTLKNHILIDCDFLSKFFSCSKSNLLSYYISYFRNTFWDKINNAPPDNSRKTHFLSTQCFLHTKAGGKNLPRSMYRIHKKPKTIYNQTGEDHVRQNQIQIYWINGKKFALQHLLIIPYRNTHLSREIIERLMSPKGDN